VNTRNIEVTNQTTSLENIHRPDEVFPCEMEKELIKCSPHKIRENSIVIPRIL
jgi:Asp-tRNA(Asn)/Glu-tRNA(Gln) amidotransferase C subunit